MKKFVIPVAGIVIILGIFLSRTAISDFIFEIKKPALPPAQEVTSFAQDTPPNPIPKPDTPLNPPALLPAGQTLPQNVNLAVPFTSQAPHRNWALPYKEACEEASMMMINSYYKKKMLPAAVADEEIKQLVSWQIENLGEYEDTDAQQNADILKKYFDFDNIQLIYDFSEDNIKKHLAAGRPVLLPVAGRELKNPFFTPPGPLYHMIVIKGYTKDGRFITNDPGTRRGADYIYSGETLLNAAHDWNEGDISKGKKVIIVVYPK